MAVKLSTILDQLAPEVEAVTQREKLLIAKALDASYAEVMQDTTLVLIALVWIKEKHQHGGADWDSILDATDLELIDRLGLTDVEDDLSDAEGNAESSTGGATTPSGPSWSTSGTSTKPISASPPESNQASTTS